MVQLPNSGLNDVLIEVSANWGEHKPKVGLVYVHAFVPNLSLNAQGV